jgi:hypothetical protein
MEDEFQKCCQKGHCSTDEVEMCDLGMLRVEWLRDNPRSSDAIEHNAPGCPWAMDSLPEFGNCWWKFMSHSGVKGVGCSEEFIARSLHLSVRQVREILANSKKKMMEHKAFKEMKELLDAGDLFPDSHEDDHDLEFYTPTGFSFVEHSTKTTGAGEDDGSVSQQGDSSGKVTRRGPKITPLVPSPDL